MRHVHSGFMGAGAGARALSIASLAILLGGCGSTTGTEAAAADSATTDAATTEAAADDGGKGASDATPDVESEHAEAAPGPCATELPLACGASLAGSTIAAERATWDGYGCSQRGETGLEAIHAFATDVARTVTIRLDDLGADLDLFVLDACDPFACVAASPTPGDIQDFETITFDAEAGRTYFVVVDGYAGAAGGYTLTAECAAPR